MYTGHRVTNLDNRRMKPRFGLCALVVAWMGGCDDRPEVCLDLESCCTTLSDADRRACEAASESEEATECEAALGVYQTAGLCGTEPCFDDPDCSSEAPVCDFRTGQCVVGCSSDASCSPKYPSCNVGGANLMAPSVCVCTASSCDSGEICLPSGFCGLGCTQPGMQDTCAPGEICQPDGTCGGAGDCTPGEIGLLPCAAGEVCNSARACEPLCEDLACLPSERLCSRASLGSSTFNQCIEPGAVTGGCPNAGSVTRSAGGPIIAEVRLSRAPFSDPACSGAGDPLVQEFQMTAYVFSSAGLPGALFQDGVRLLSQGNPRNTFNTPMASLISMDPVATYEIRFALCLSTADMMQSLAVLLNDAEGNRSNPFCFTGQ